LHITTNQPAIYPHSILAVGILCAACFAYSIKNFIPISISQFSAVYHSKASIFTLSSPPASFS